MDRNATKELQKGLLLPRRDFLKKTIIVGAATIGWAQHLFAQGTMEYWEVGDPQCGIQLPPAVTPTYQLDRELLSSFIGLSEALTGVAPLDRNLAYEYLQRIAVSTELTFILPNLIASYRAITSSAGAPDPAKIDERIMQDQSVPPDAKPLPGGEPLTVRDGAEQVIYLWYVSAFFLARPKYDDKKKEWVIEDPKKKVWIYGSPEQYEKALLWSVIRAHAPMTAGGPYGYWADAPSA